MAFIESTTDIWILLYWCGGIFCIVILFSQIIGLAYNSTRLTATNRESWVSKQGGTFKILLSLFTTYTCSIIGIAVVIRRLGNATNEICNYTYMLSFMLFATSKICNYYFFLQRAKLAQGLNKILPDIVFERIFPILFIILYISYIILIIFIPIRGELVESENTGRILCKWITPDVEHLIIFGISVIFDLSMTIFFLYLYGKPMCDIIKNSSSKLRKSQQLTKSESKFKRCIMVNFICSSVSTVHTAITALTWWNTWFFGYWIIMDYVINAICMFGMFASNRRCCLHCCCFHVGCYDKKEKRNKNKKKSVKVHTMNIIQEEEKQKQGPNTPISNHAQSNTLTVGLHLQQNSSSIPSLNTMSDFPQPPNVLNDNDIYKNLPTKHVPVPSGSSQRSSYIGAQQLKKRQNQNQDTCERNNYTSTDGINYIEYLENTSCWYYKSKLFWTWLIYYFCFCRCYVFVNKYFCSKSSSLLKKKKDVMKYLFSAAKKVQYNRYYQRFQAPKTNNKKQDDVGTTAKFQKNYSNTVDTQQTMQPIKSNNNIDNDDDKFNIKPGSYTVTAFSGTNEIELR